MKEGVGGDERNERCEQSAKGAEEMTRINFSHLALFPKAASEHVGKILCPLLNLPKAPAQARLAGPCPEFVTIAQIP